jgi:hypothetical protein
MNSVTPKAAVEYELFFNKPATGHNNPYILCLCSKRQTTDVQEYKVPTSRVATIDIKSLKIDRLRFVVCLLLAPAFQV